MNKKVLVGSGVAALVIGAVVGLICYTRKSIRKIANGLTDMFDDIENEDYHFYHIEQKEEQINGQKVKTSVAYPQGESVTVEMPVLKIGEKNCNNTIYNSESHLRPISIEQRFDEMFKEKCENCPCKKNEKPAFQYLFDDQLYKDYIDTVNMFDGDDGK